VRVEEYRDPDLPGGLLHLERLGDAAAAFCSSDGRFGILEWESRRLRAHATELDGPVQTLRAHGDTIVIATTSEIGCFDAYRGEPRWRASLGETGGRLLDATSDVAVVTNGKRVVALSPKGGELWSQTSRGAVDARVSDDHLIIVGARGVTVRALTTGEEEWGARAAGQVVVADDHLLVPGRANTSVVYSLHDATSAKVKTSVAMGRPAPPAIRTLGGPVVPVVAMTGDIVLFDLAGAVEADRAAPTFRDAPDSAWIAGPFLITTPSLTVAPLWGGVATPIPLPLDPATATLVAGPSQLLVRGVERTAWLGLS
jgi:hypothetical protein